MHPTRRNNLKLEISNRLFVNGETCYYAFFVPLSSLDTEKMRYFYDIEFQDLANVEITINNGTSLQKAKDTVKVGFSSGYRFQYTAEDNKIYMSMLGKVPSYSSQLPLFSMSIKLRSFEIRPTVIVPVEEPEETKPDKPVDTNVIIDESEEQQNDTEEQEPIIKTEYETVTVRKKLSLQEYVAKKPRKSQFGLTVLSLSTFVAILIYACATKCASLLSKRQERAQLRARELTSTIEISLHNNTNEQHGLMT